MAKFATLTDTFTATSLDTGKWNYSDGVSDDPTVSYTSSGVNIAFPASSTSNTSGSISANNSYDLTDSEIVIKVDAVPLSSTNAEGIIWLKQSNAAWNNGQDWIRMFKDATSLYFQSWDGGGIKLNASITYDADAHRWWKIHHSSSTLRFSTSPDGIVWTQQATTSVYAMNIASLWLEINALCYKAESNPGSFKVRNFNVKMKGLRVRKSGNFLEKPVYQKISGSWRQVDANVI